MKYDLNVILENVPAFLELRNSQRKYKGPLSEYKKKTIGDFISEYKDKRLKGKGNGVYDKLYDDLVKLVAPEEYEAECEMHVVDNSVKPVKPDRYSIEDLLSHNERVIPYVSNIHQTVGKMMDIAINQAVEILDNHSTSISVKYGNVLKYYFIDHKPYCDIATTINDSDSNVRDNIIKKFMKGEFFYAGICISESFMQKIVSLMDSLLFQVCDTVFEENDIDTQEKIEFAKTLAGYDMLDNMKEWGNVLVLTKDSYKNVTRQHLISLKKAFCGAIVPIHISSLIERSKSDFVTKNDVSEFNEQIIESFVKSHPWIQTDDEGRYYLLTRHLEGQTLRQGRIIFEAGEPIHHNRVREIYKTIYGENYKTLGIQKLKEHNFYPYGKSGLWYYSEDGKQIKLAGKVIAKYVDEHVCFYWKDLSVVVTQLCRINKKYNKRRIRMEVTNLCYVDKNDKDHFVKKGEEANYPLFLWSRPKQNRTNWCVNHAYEMLKESPNGEMKWVDFENQFKQDLQETGRPVKVIDDVKYIHSGSVNEDNKNDEDHVFIRENDVIRINEYVIQNKYNGDLSMYGLYRKCPEFQNDILSLAMTELRKQKDNKMLLVDFIALTLDNIESDGKIDAKYIRRIFNNNDNLPQGLSRYNDNGSVYIKYDPVIVEEDTKDDLQYEITTLPSDEIQTTPQVFVSEESRKPVTYATRFNWDDVKNALKSDLAFYDSPFWYQGITSSQVLDKFVKFLSSSNNYNLNDLVPQIIYEFHYARIDRYDHYQYLRNLPVAFEALLRDIYESSHRPIKTSGIKSICENGFAAFDEALTNHEKKGFGRILNDLVYKRNKLLHGENLELSPVTLVQNIIEYLALFVYTVSKYALDV